MSFVSIEPSPEFPHSDITDRTASILEVMLGNAQLVEQVHGQAEAANAAFRLSHAAIERTGVAMELEMIQGLGYTQGAAVYETIAALVRPDITLEHDALLLHIYSLLALAETDQFAKSLIFDMKDEFAAEQPNTHEVVRGAAVYHGMPLPTDYFVAGAAIARQLDKDIKDGFSV
jgi:hypothetical protein